LILYKETQVAELKSPIFDQFGVRILVKREDANHPEISGNKWWKLKYNLVEASRLRKKTILTFGGAFSNHIYATAAAARELRVSSIGVIRGEETLPLNPTLLFAKHAGMKLTYVSREVYRRKTEPEFLTQLTAKFGDFYLIPEGGTNELAIQGCAEFGRKLIDEIDFDYVCLPVGTAGTMAGLLQGMKGQKKVFGFSSLKGGEFLEEEIKKYTRYTNGHLIHDYHFGGYAKTTAELISFSNRFEQDFGIPVDMVYTSKMIFGVFDLISKGVFERGSRVLIIHTGGLQGRHHNAHAEVKQIT
jgi:1-aminocyclopropane-1-carboxylate deaminase